MFTMTPSATQEILAAAQRSDAAGMALRIAARQLADGSIEYGMGFDEEREDDEPTKFGDLTVLLGSPSKPLLETTVLDYAEIEPGRFDFVFVPLDETATADDGSVAPAKPRGACGSGGCGSCGS